MAERDISDMINFDLEDMFSYSYIPIIISLIIFLILFIIYYHFFIRKKKVPVQFHHHVGVDALKRTYLKRLDDIIEKYHKQTINDRQVYIQLSRLIRGFAYEMTGIKLQNCTLEDISKLDIPQLYNLVYEYYDPEFAKFSQGHSPIVINRVLVKTREVIDKWI